MEGSRGGIVRPWFGGHYCLNAGGFRSHDSVDSDLRCPGIVGRYSLVTVGLSDKIRKRPKYETVAAHLKSGKVAVSGAVG